MKKIFLAALSALVLLIPSVATAKDARVAKAEAWFKNLTYAQARFEQKGHDGTVLSGNFFLYRPGRLRFEYDAPIKDLVVADGLMIHFYDAQQEQASNAPVGTTLADFILRKDPSLEGDLEVENVRSRGGITSITVTQKADPSAGKLTLFFREDPYELKSWEIIDSRGLPTLITLKGLHTGTPLSPSLFIFKDPSGRGRFNN